MPWRRKDKPEQPPLKLLLWTALAGLVFGLIGFGEIGEDILRSSRNSLHPHKASGDIVLVRIDDESLRRVGRWPWGRDRHADLTDALTDAGARRIFFDLAFFGPTEAGDDRRFARAIERSGRVVLPVKARWGADKAGGENKQQDSLPLPMLARHAAVGNISVRYNYQNAVWRLPFEVPVAGRPVQSFAAQLADRPAGSAQGSFLIDYSLDPDSIPSISAASVLDRRVDPAAVRGKDVLVGWTTDSLGDTYFVPGTGKMGGAYVHAIGAETLKAGRPLYFGWSPLFLLALLIGAAALRSVHLRRQSALLAAGVLLMLVGTAPLEAHLVFLDVMPGLFVLLVVAAAVVRRQFRRSGLVDPVSGLPNLNALKANRAGREQALVVARVLNFTEIVASLPPNSEPQLVDQIVSRLTIGRADRILYQGDGGIFAWFEEGRQAFGHHIEALHALFRNPARVAGLPVDLSISFGVEIGSSRSLANRRASAQVAADEAAHDGLKWKYHDPETLQDASWKLSMLSQLDDAVDRGEVWVAYQPKLELATRRIVGAEALARWTHPVKGPIAASEFIAAAEQHGRIAKLTDFVMEDAIRAASAVGRRHPGFGIAVNLSARLLVDRGLRLRLAAMLARHGVAADALTLELTETAALGDNGAALETLASLQELGVRISIDDYGTGMSTLEYLKKIPASEIKIDQSFVRSLCDNRSDRLMVQSTISLAHSLGRRVVAEGVERRDVLDALIAMGCDIAQGFIIGRPMSLESLLRRIASDRRRQSA